MKRMMIMMAVIGLTVAAQASNVKWGFSAGNLGTSFANGTVYLVYSSAATTASYLGGLDGVATSFSSGQITGSIVTSGTLDANGAYYNGTGYTITPTTLGTTAGTKSFYLVAISADGSELAYSSVNKSVNIQPSALSATMNINAGTEIVKIVAAPEPTSMALLAIGGAVFGLRRKFRK